MILDTILSGLSAVASITTLLQSSDTRGDNEARAAIYHISSRVAVLEREVTKASARSQDDQALLRSYNGLLQALRTHRHYASRLEFRPTDYGTWKLLIKKEGRDKPTILRDPEGEYSQGILSALPLI